MRLPLGVFVASALAGGALSAQQGVFKSRVDTVEVHVTVRNADGSMTAGLTKNDFELLDNGKRRDITVFSADIQPVSMALVLDRSGSVSDQAQRIAAAAESFVNGLLPADQAAIHTLTMECAPLTHDGAALTAVLRGPMGGDMGSPVWAGADRSMTALNGVSGRRAILLFSDGDDFGPVLMPLTGGPRTIIGAEPGPCRYWPDQSEASLQDLSRRAQREGIMIYTVGVENPKGQANDGDLRSLARGTGGDRYKLRDQSELSAAFTRIVDELHHQYLLGFVPDALDGKVHSLSVRVKKPGLSVRARESYVAMSAVTRPNAPLAPVAPLSATEIDRAIRDGASGQRLQAVCTAFGLFPRSPIENDVMASVVLEGPTGRIMRAAREARAEKRPFSAADVSEEMRALTVLVSAELKRPQQSSDQSALTSADPPPPGMTPTPSPTPLPTVPPGTKVSNTLSPLVAIRVRGKLLTEQMLKPLDAAPIRMGVPIGSVQQRSERFDLAAFRALPGPDLEIVVRSAAGTRQCSISEKDRAAVR